MSYVYSVYSFRPQHFPLESLVDSPGKEIIASTFFLIAVAGVAGDFLVIYIFYKYFTYWRFIRRLWINISLNAFFGSTALLFHSIGDVYEEFSDTPFFCKLRYFVPIALDIGSFGNLVIMFVDRITIVHFPNLYIYNQKNNNTKLMYIWFYGLWFLIFKMLIIDQRNIPERCVTPMALAFPVETASLINMALMVTLLLITYQGYVFTPTVTTTMQITWLQQEVSETIQVLLLGAGISLLWAPKQCLCLGYLTYGVPEFEYQIWMMLLHIPARLSLLVPLLVLLRNADFRHCVACVLKKSEGKQTLINTITAEEVQADFILRSMLKALYPNHPELQTPGMTQPNYPRSAMLSAGSGGRGQSVGQSSGANQSGPISPGGGAAAAGTGASVNTSKRPGTMSTVTFEPSQTLSLKMVASYEGSNIDPSFKGSTGRVS